MRITKVILIISSIFFLSGCTSISQVKIKYEDNFWKDLKTGITFHWTTDYNMFPASWKAEPINITATKIDQELVQAYINLLLFELKKYPRSLLAESVTTIYLLNDLHFYNNEWGATFFNNIIYLTNKKTYDNEFLSGSLHREIGNILLESHGGFVSQHTWEKCNPEGFQYGDETVKTLRFGKADLEGHTVLYLKGFLNVWALRNYKADFLEYATSIFNGYTDIWYYYSEFDRMRQKIDLVIRFYHLLHPQFSIEYFRSLNCYRLR